MKVPPLSDESARPRILHDYNILDTLPEADFVKILELAAQICGVPIALITLIDEKWQWFKAKVGLCDAETRRETAFCAHAATFPPQPQPASDPIITKPTDSPAIPKDPTGIEGFDEITRGWLPRHRPPICIMGNLSPRDRVLAAVGLSLETQ